MKKWIFWTFGLFAVVMGSCNSEPIVEPENDADIEITIDGEEEKEEAVIEDTSDEGGEVMDEEYIESLTDVRLDLVTDNISELDVQGFDPNQLPQDPRGDLEANRPNREFPFQPQRIERLYMREHAIDESMDLLESFANLIANLLTEGELELAEGEVHLIPALYYLNDGETSQIAWLVVNLTEDILTDLLFEVEMFTDKGEEILEKVEIGASASTFGYIEPNHIVPLYLSTDLPYSAEEWISLTKDTKATLHNARELTEEEVETMDESDEQFDPTAEER